MNRIFKYTIYGFIITATILFGSCRSNQKVSSSYSAYKFNTTCLATNADGSQTLRAFGNGRDKATAIEEALKNALYDVIFKGTSGSGECNKPPLVTEVNARERYAEYFDRFFTSGGEYRKFVKESSNKDNSRIESSSNYRQNYGIVVDVDRVALRRQLVDDGILKN